MRVMVLCGSHLRHLYFASKLIETVKVVGIIKYKREEMVPQPPVNIDSKLKKLFSKHFADRKQIEKKFFGDPNFKNLLNHQNILTVDNVIDFNSSESIKFIHDCNPDIAFVFGTRLIHDEMLKILPKYTINLHLGLSPFYKGAATLFWPFYFLEPQMAGSTFHIVTSRIDAGPIVCQVLPNMELGDGIHDIGAKTVVKSAEEAQRIINYFEKNQYLPLNEQKGNGKLFFESDFYPHHLRCIYELHNNKLVDKYLCGEIIGRNPQILSLER